MKELNSPVSPAQSQSWAGQVPVDVDKDTIVIGYLYDEALLDSDTPLLFFIPTDGSNAVTVNQLDSNFTYTVPEGYFLVPALALNEMYVGLIGHLFDLVNNRPDGMTDEDFIIALLYGSDPIIESAFGKYIGEAAYSAADLTFVDFRDALARAIEASPENQTYITLMIPSVPILSDQVLLDAYVESAVLFARDQFGLQPDDVGLLAELANIPTNYDPLGGSNTAPTADAGPDQTNVASSATVTLDGSGSTDPDVGDTLSYAWSQTSGATVTLSGGTTAGPSFTAPVLGANDAAVTLVFSLVVTDDKTNASAPDTVSITVQPAANAAPTANAGPDQSAVASGAAVTLDGSGSTDPDVGDTLSYAWSQTSGATVTLSGGTTAGPSFTAPVLGANDAAVTLVFSLVVTDDKVKMSKADTVSITVNAPAKASFASFIASPDELLADGRQISLITVTLRDQDGRALLRDGEKVALFTTLGTFGEVSETGVGTYASFLTASTVAGDALITATANGLPLSGQAIVRMKVDVETVQETFTQVTSNFIHRRVDRILSVEPRSNRLERRRDASDRPTFSINLQQSKDGAVSRFQMSGKLGEIPRLGVNVDGSGPSGSTHLNFSGRAATQDGRWYFWTEGQYSAYQDGTGTLLKRDGDFGAGFAGLDFLVTERLSFGIMAQGDQASERIDRFSRVSGHGWMVGPYLSAEVAPDLFLTGRVAWGKSSNSAEIDIFDDGTAWIGEFETERFLARGSVYGQYAIGRVLFTPQVDMAYMRERQTDYIVSNGVSGVSMPGIIAEVGRMSVSGEAEWAIGRGDDGVLAFVSPRLDWDFLNSGAASGQDRTRGSLEVGVRTASSLPWQGEASIRYDGIGQSSFSAWNLLLSSRFAF